MQALLKSDIHTNTLIALDQSLRQQSDPPDVSSRLDPLSQMILSMLGIRTLERISLQAFSTLRNAYPDWQALCNAPTHTILSHIQDVTFADIKARRIQLALTVIQQKRGKLDLSFLRDLAIDDAIFWLETLPGVGRKISAATLNFSTLHKRALVIDTHHLRVLKRIGIISAKADFHDAYDIVMSHIPESWDATHLETHHYYVKKLGQHLCTAHQACCRQCRLQQLCKHAQQSASPRTQDYSISRAHLHFIES